MSKISNLDYASLNLFGDNYLQWALDTEIVLKSKDLGECIIEDNNTSESNRYRAIMITRQPHYLKPMRLQRKRKKKSKESSHVHQDKPYGCNRDGWKGRGHSQTTLYDHGHMNHYNRGCGPSFGHG